MRNLLRKLFSIIYRRLLSLLPETSHYYKNQELVEIRNQILENTTVDEVMIPRSDICAVKSINNLQEICKTLVTTQHTRVLIYREDLDDIIGFIHLKDVFKCLVTDVKFDLASIIRKPIVTTSTQKISTLFNQMRFEGVHIALVIDEYGGTKGMITIENIIEKELGQIADEYDEDELQKKDIMPQATGYIVSGRTKIHDLENILEIDLSTDLEEEYETIAGLIISKIGYMPKQGEKINVDNKIICLIIDSTDRVISKVKIELVNI